MVKPRNIILSIAAIVLALGIGGVIFLLNHQIPYRGIDELRKSTGLAVVLPNPLPGDMVIADQPTYSETSKSIITRMSAAGSSITLSQQKRPETSLQQIDAADTFLVNVGSVYILKGEEGRLQAIVETPDSWLMVNAEESIGNSTFKNFLESLVTI